LLQDKIYTVPISSLQRILASLTCRLMGKIIVRRIYRNWRARRNVSLCVREMCI